MSRAKKFLSIIIPVHNNFDALKNLLNSINHSRFDNFADIEVDIVDDGSNVKANIPILNDRTRISIYYLKKNRGPAYSRNYGVSKSTGQYILFLDADVTLYKDTLQNAYNFFAQKKGLAFTGIWDKEQKTNHFFPQFKALRDYAYWFIEREENARYYLFSTRIAGIEKKLFDKIGGFNTNYKKATVEDIELTYKIEQNTKIAFESDIIVHHEFEDFVPLAKKYFARSRDWIKLYLKRLRFDPVATSSREAYKSIAIGCAIICLFLAVIVQNKIFIIFSLLFIIYYLFLDSPFLLFIKKEKGAGFMLKAIPTSLVLYMIINIGSTVGLIEYFLKK